MAQATLDVPLSLDPRQATKLVVVTALVEFTSRSVLIDYELRDNADNVLERRRVTASGAQVQTWINNQEATIYGRLLASLGVTGTVA